MKRDNMFHRMKMRYHETNTAAVSKTRYLGRSVANIDSITTTYKVTNTVNQLIL